MKQNLYINTYIYIHMYIYIYIHTCTYIYIYVSVRDVVSGVLLHRLMFVGCKANTK